jgi:hypothetical protein
MTAVTAAGGAATGDTKPQALFDLFLSLGQETVVSSCSLVQY